MSAAVLATSGAAHGATRTAPLGPEVYEDGDAGVLDDVVERGSAPTCRGSLMGWKGGLAGSALAGVGEVGLATRFFWPQFLQVRMTGISILVL